MLIVGLTGGIGTGKSTVSKRFHNHHNLQIIDADLIARQVVEPGQRAYRQIIKEFGNDAPDLVLEDGSLNRPALGSVVFGNSEKLSKLNSITHPAVRKQIVWQLFKSWIFFKDMVILDVPLLFESGLDAVCGITVNVFCDSEIQLNRILQRDTHLSKEDVQKRISSQMTSDERNERCDKIILNNSDLEDLNEEVDLLVLELRPPIWKTLIQMIPPVGIFCGIMSLFYKKLGDQANKKVKET